MSAYNYEIWIVLFTDRVIPGDDPISRHRRVAVNLSAQMANDIMKRLNKLVIISEIPDMYVYVRQPGELTYNIRLNDKIVRVLYNAQIAYETYAKYKQHVERFRGRLTLRVQMSSINNNLARNMRVDAEFLRIQLKNDPVYGTRPAPVIVDYPDSYYEQISTFTYEQVMLMIASIDKQRIRRIVRWVMSL